MRSFILPPLAGEVRRSRIGGGERSEPVSRMLIMPYDTESQSRNVLASPLGEEGHKVAKGWTVVILIMILDVDVTAEGGIIKLIARRAIPPPFEPFEPYEPSEPSQRRCVQWHSRIGGGERSEPVSRMVIITYDTER